MLTNIVSHIPTWVFALLAGLVMQGLRQTQVRDMSRQRVYALPLVFAGLSLWSLWSIFGENPVGLLAWVAAVLIAAPVTLSLPRPSGRPIAQDMVRVEGSWIPLALILCIFFTRFAVAAVASVKPELRSTLAFPALSGLGYGFWSGIFLVRGILLARSIAANSTKPVLVAA